MDEKTQTRFYRFYVCLGIRCLSDEDFEKNLQDSHPDPLLEVKATLAALYLSKQEVTEEELNLFAEKYVYYHAWPYWREMLQSTCVRLGLRPLVIPPYRVN